MVFIALKDNILVSANDINFIDQQTRGPIFDCIDTDCCNGKLTYVKGYTTKMNNNIIREPHFRHEKKLSSCSFENYCNNENTLSDFHKKWTRELIKPEFLFKFWFLKQYYDIKTTDNIGIKIYDGLINCDLAKRYVEMISHPTIFILNYEKRKGHLVKIINNSELYYKLNFKDDICDLLSNNNIKIFIDIGGKKLFNVTGYNDIGYSILLIEYNNFVNLYLKNITLDSIKERETKSIDIEYYCNICNEYIDSDIIDEHLDDCENNICNICNTTYSSKFEYNKHMNGHEYDKIINQSFQIAEYIYEKYKNKFICASVKSNIWYEFSNHKWSVLEQGHSLKTLILTDIYNDYVNLSNKLSDKNLYNINFATRKKEEIAKILKTIRDIRKLNEIMEFLKLKFHNMKFEEMLDENRNIIGFKNGVYDLENMIFRAGKPDDYISLSTGINYKELDINDPNYNKVMKIINDMFPDPNIRDYIMTFLASCLDGNTNQQFDIWTGSGGNGKSILVNNLIKVVFGEYYIVVDSTLITRNRGSSSSASPEKLKLKGRCIGVLNEPDSRDTIKVGHMKELTGSDTINARGLFKDTISFKPQVKLVMLCNVAPKIKSNDGGTWRRIHVVPFETKFVDKPSSANERNIDRTLESKITQYAQIFMSILIEEYKKYKANGLDIPEKVKYLTQEYREINI